MSLYVDPGMEKPPRRFNMLIGETCVTSDGPEVRIGVPVDGDLNARLIYSAEIMHALSQEGVQLPLNSRDYKIKRLVQLMNAEYYDAEGNLGLWGVEIQLSRVSSPDSVNPFGLARFKIGALVEGASAFSDGPVKTNESWDLEIHKDQHIVDM